MTRLALLVRGINVGGKHKVVMAQLRQELTELGLENVETYINSGNIFFDTSISKTQLVEILQAFFDKHYPFIQHFSLLSQEDYEEELRTLPEWWFQEMARKDVLFYTEGLDIKQVIEKVESMKLGDEGSSGANSQKKPIAKQSIISSCLRCLSIVILLFEMQKPLTKSVNF